MINPDIQELTIDGLRPVLQLVANARARYLKALFNLGTEATEAQFAGLAKLGRE